MAATAKKAAKASTPILVTGGPSSDAGATVMTLSFRSSGSTNSQAGFSLLEIMMVVVVIGILIAIFTLSVGSFSDDVLGEHARRLQVLLDLAAEDATMQGREIGLQFYQHGYEFSARFPGVDEDGLQIWLWQPLDDDRLLKPRDLGEDYSVELIIEAKEVDLDYDRQEEEEYRPQIFILSSGDVAPAFEVRMRPAFGDGAILLSVDNYGVTELTTDEY
jgi:general secretion pathway protein H